MIVRYEKVIFARFHLELSTSHTCIRVYTREHQPLRSRRCASVVESMHTVFCIFLRLDTDIFEFHEQRGESTTDSTINFDFHHDSRPYFDSAWRPVRDNVMYTYVTYVHNYYRLHRTIYSRINRVHRCSNNYRKKTLLSFSKKNIPEISKYFFIPFCIVLSVYLMK